MDCQTWFVTPKHIRLSRWFAKGKVFHCNDISLKRLWMSLEKVRKCYIECTEY